MIPFSFVQQVVAGHCQGLRQALPANYPLMPYTNQGGRATARPWQTAGVSVEVAEKRRLVCEALWHASDPAVVVRVYEGEAVRYARKVTDAPERLNAIVQEAVAAFRAALPARPRRKEPTDVSWMLDEMREQWQRLRLSVPLPYDPASLPEAVASAQESDEQ